MTLIARAIPAGEAGVDTTEIVTATIAAAWKAAGKRWALRYALSLTSAEVATVTGGGLGLVLLSYGRRSDFSAATGAADAQAILTHLRGIGVPLGGELTIGVDLEDPAGATVADVLAYEAGFAGEIVAVGCTSGAYIGSGLMMTSAQLYSMKATRYYKSGSRIVDSAGAAAEPQCGWVLVQGLPFNQACGGANVDYDCAWQDFEGRGWVALYDSTALAAIAISPTTP
jgi:Domain of unknown function (DUF1906)